jgi:uncharacterized protein YkwD
MFGITRWTTRAAAFVAVLVLVALGPLALAPAGSSATAASTAECLDSVEQAFLIKINNYRASKGLGKLTATRSLNTAAYKHSLDMAKNRFFSHTGSNGSTPWQRMAAAGYNYNTPKAENIAAGQNTAEQVFNSWMNSSGHNKNMLNPSFKAIGIGRVTLSGTPYKYYWTTDFGGVLDAKPVC